MIRPFPQSGADAAASHADPVESDPRWQAILTRDRTADGTFWYSVQTTGIYCRPSCASRRPRPGNVTLHDSLHHARASGCRACLRCRPDAGEADPDAAAVIAACRQIEAAGGPVTLAALATVTGVAPSRLRAAFLRQTGLSPRAYAAALRASRLRAALPGAGRVADAAFEAGFGAMSRFYAEASPALGMAPQRYRRFGAGESLRMVATASRLGHVLLAFSARGIAAIALGDDPATLRADMLADFAGAVWDEPHPGDHDRLDAVIAALDGLPGEALPLDIRGTVFQHRVWAALCAIPPGETVSYGELATRLGQPDAARAVAGACAANRLAVVVPCHRVVRNDGGLGGYRWGVGRKHRLLAREREDTDA